MMKKNKLIIAIMIVAAIGILAVTWGTFLGGPNLASGEKSILVLAVDESEKRPGMGGVDMAFVVDMKNGSISKYTPVYPGGKTHPTQPEPAAAGGGSKLLLHDSLWESDTKQGMQYAREIVEATTNLTPDAVVAINTEALDAIISSAGQIKVDGVATNVSAVDLIRENDQLHGGSMSRGESVMTLASAISTAANEGTSRSAMIQAALNQYSKGNIVMVPEGSFVGLMASKGIGSLF